MPIIKRYPNRKLYNTEAKSYITLDEIAGLIRRGDEISVIDHASGEDLTAVTLSQVVLELEKHEGGFLPHPVFAGLIKVRNKTLEAVRHALLSPLDLSRHVDEEIGRRIGLLVKYGEMEALEGQRTLDLLRSRNWNPVPMEVDIEGKIEEVLLERQIPTNDDIKNLLSQIDLLSTQLEELALKSR